MSVFPQLLAAAERWQRTFHQPMTLQAKKHVAVVTCMDSRVMPAQIFGFELGDAEYIRNAGGRVTKDVERSLLVAQEILHTKEIILMHHTDCGGQHAYEKRNYLLKRLQALAGPFLAPLIQLTAVFGLDKKLLLPIKPGVEGLEQSVREDCRKLRRSLVVPPYINIYGMTYDVMTGAVHEVVRDMGKGHPPEGGKKQS